MGSLKDKRGQSSEKWSIMNPENMEQLRQWWKTPKKMSHWRAKDHSWNRTLMLWRQWKEEEVRLITLRKGSFVLKKGHLLHNEKVKRVGRSSIKVWKANKRTQRKIGKKENEKYTTHFAFCINPLHVFKQHCIISLHKSSSNKCIACHNMASIALKIIWLRNAGNPNW